MIEGRSRADLDKNRLLNLALVRLLEIVGEAANRIPEEVRGHHSGILWLQLIGLRNRLIHGYDRVDFDILWEILTKDLEPLVKELDKVVGR